MPLLRQTMDAEDGHVLAVRALAAPGWMRPKDRGVDGDELRTKIWDLELSNPVGLAAGFDKDAQAIDGLFDLGFGYVEIGSVTPELQPGNPKPRFFRLEEDSACINRYGFNSLGHRQALHRLQSRVRDFAISHPSIFPSPLPLNPLPPVDLPRSLRPGRLLAVNLGKNKTSSADSNEDYLAGVRMLGPYADVLVINVSSPNTPGLRGLQGKDFLGKLLGEVVAERDGLKVDERLKPKVVVKVAPDLDESELEDIAGAVRMSKVDGVIVSNTTVKRAGLGLLSEHAAEVGGLSGKPVKPLSLFALSTLRSLLPPSIPIIGCGGISNAEDALDFLRAGASFVQAYTAFGFAGVGFPRELKDDIADQLKVTGTTWRSEVEKAKSKWSSGVDRVGQELKEEVERLKDVLEGMDLIPQEDLLAEQGLGGITRSLVEETPSVEQSLVVTTPVEVDVQLIEATPISSATEDVEQPAGGNVIEAVVIEAAVLPTVTADDRADTLAWRSAVNAEDRRIV